jgi:hypothetical protein
MLTRPSAAAPSAKKSIPSACSSVAASAVELARTKPLLVTRAEATAALGRWAHGQRGLSRRRQQADPTQSGCCLHSLYERAGSAASRSLAGGSRARTAVGRRVTLGTPNVRDLRAAIVQADTCASLNGQFRSSDQAESHPASDRSQGAADQAHSAVAASRSPSPIGRASLDQPCAGEHYPHGSARYGARQHGKWMVATARDLWGFGNVGDDHPLP